MVFTQLLLLGLVAEDRSPDGFLGSGTGDGSGGESDEGAGELSVRGGGVEVEELRRRNSELEREATEARAREEEVRRDLERTRERLRAIEKAEERLSVEFGEFEAEGVKQARAYHLRIKVLSDQLAVAHGILTSAGFHSTSPSVSSPSTMAVPAREARRGLF